MNIVPDWLAWILRPRDGGAALDETDPKDWTDERLMGAQTFLGGEKQADGEYPDSNMFNGYATKQKGQSCTSHGLTGVIQTMFRFGVEFKDHKDNILGIIDGQPARLWEDQQVKWEGTEGSADKNKGDYLTNALKTCIVRGVPVTINGQVVIVKIKGYARLKSNEVDKWLAKGFPVFTGSRWFYQKIGNFYRSFDKNGYLFESGRDGGGHAWYIVGKKTLGYREKYKPIKRYLMVNSHGLLWGLFRSGTAYVSEEKLRRCFSKYIVDIDWVFLEAQLNEPSYAKKVVEHYYESKKS